MDKKADWRRELEKVIQLTAREPKKLNLLLNDLLSTEELAVLPVRWQIIKRLDQGQPQHEIAKELGVGITTVTRGSKMLQNKKGGFQQVLKMLKK